MRFSDGDKILMEFYFVIRIDKYDMLQEMLIYRLGKYPRASLRA